jgi:hypothetical protein
MKRSLKIILLLIILSQVLFLPVAAKAISPDCFIEVNEYMVTQPATSITSSSAVFNGTWIYEVIFHGLTITEPDGLGSPFVFKYGTAPGIYSEEIEAEIVKTDAKIRGDKIRINYIFSADVSNLRPCTAYYVLFAWNETAIFSPITICFKEYPAKEISFDTIGCMSGSGSHQAGGMDVIAPTTKLFIPSNIIVQNASISQTKVSPGETVNVSATVANRGGSNGTAKIILYVNGQEADSRGIAVSSGQTIPVDFTVSENEPGTYAVYVSGVSAGSFVVDSFTNNDMLIYGIIALFTIGIAGTLYLIVRKRTA